MANALSRTRNLAASCTLTMSTTSSTKYSCSFPELGVAFAKIICGMGRAALEARTVSADGNGYCDRQRVDSCAHSVCDGGCQILIASHKGEWLI